MRSSKLSFFAAGAVTALVLGGGTAFAATGGNFILGRSNAATTTTTLTNSAGTALAVNSKAGTPTLKVGNTVRIPSLNADTVDGVHAGSFARTAGRTGSFDFPGQDVDSDGNRKIDTIVASGACPSGTQLTGGGMSDFTQTGFTVVNAPDVDPESWLVAVPVDETVAENPTDVVASVVCYKPTGPIAGAYGIAPQQSDATSELSATTMRRLAAKAAARKQDSSWLGARSQRGSQSAVPLRSSLCTPATPVSLGVLFIMGIAATASQPTAPDAWTAFWACSRSTA